MSAILAGCARDWNNMAMNLPPEEQREEGQEENQDVIDTDSFCDWYLVHEGRNHRAHQQYG